MLIGDGWNKDGDYNTAFSKTVLPLPSHARPDYDTPPGDWRTTPSIGAIPRDWERVPHALRHPPDLPRRAQASAAAGRESIADRSRGRCSGDSVGSRSSCSSSGLLGRCPGRSTAGPSPEAIGAAPRWRSPKAPSRYGFRLEEVSKASGIDFVHQAPTLDAKLDHIMPQIASMGAAVSVVDFDRDGWQDLYVTNSGEGSQNRLYRNRRRRHVRGRGRGAGRRRREPGRDRRLDGRGLGRLRQRRLRRPVPLQVGPAGAVPQRRRHAASPASPSRRPARAGSTPTAPTWLDYDRDGQLDLFVGGYWDEKLDLWHLDDHEDDAGELRVRPERRAEVPASATAATARSRTSRRSRASTAAAGPWRRRGRPARDRLSRPVHRQRLRRLGAVRQRGGQDASARSARRPASASPPRAG